jgi:hypothetical protein
VCAEDMLPIGASVGAHEPYVGAPVAELTSCSFEIRNLKVRASSESLMPGKRPAMRLLFRVVDPDRGYAPLHGVSGIVSSPFVVTTTRAKGGGEGNLLHTAHVSKLPRVGPETTKKLAELSTRAPGLESSLPVGQSLQSLRLSSITTVG